MLTRRDELLGQLTDCLGALAWAGNFIGHESGVSFVVRHHSLADITWEELETTDDPVSLARDRMAALLAD